MENEQRSDTIKCRDCGANLKFAPGTSNLTCEHCGAENAIAGANAPVKELDFRAHLHSQATASEQLTIHLVKCENCGAAATIDAHLQSAFCPYCSNALLIENAQDELVIAPKSLLPFKLKPTEAQENFRQWIRKLWFAPNTLKKAALHFDHFKGVYMPYWTYDSATFTCYTGARGIYYYTTETYTAEENGKTVTKTRQVRHTSWSPASGSFSHWFDDILICATKSLPKNLVEALEPWDLKSLVPFNKEFLSGFITEKYQVDLEAGFSAARQKMDPTIRSMAKSDIGGDEQKINTIKTDHSKITFKHILLPFYVSAYNFNNKLYQCLINARTGEVQSERPWSVIKIMLAVLLGIAIIVGGFYLADQSHGSHLKKSHIRRSVMRVKAVEAPARRVPGHAGSGE